MKEQMIISLLLLLLVVLDAAGDAFRLKGKQVLHHSLESLQVALWVAVWALFEFQPYYIAMYILGRFVMFDLVFNLIAGNKLLYVGKSSLYGRFFSWFIPRVKEPGQLLPWLKILALGWWVAWFLTNGGQ